MKKKNILFLLIFIIIVLVGCKKADNKIINIIYTTDVHCGIDNNLGYSRLKAFKDEKEKEGYVTLVDAGDYVQGDYIGAISSGEYIIDIMNEVGYDIVTLGNHEFDYGMDTLSSLINKFNGTVIDCNLNYIGSGQNPLTKIKPYVIEEYGSIKIAYIGVTTPYTLTVSSPNTFKEDGEIAYSFSGESADVFYSKIQATIDECLNKDVDLVVLVSHLGTSDSDKPFSSTEVINNTTGVDFVLDGHAHLTLPWTEYENKNGENVYLVDSGYKLNAFASITIDKDLNCSFEYVTSYDKTSESMDTFIASINKKVEELGDQIVANVDVDLRIVNEDGIRMVRNRETAIGNMVADAYRIITGADIGIINGGGIRENLNKGDVSYKDIKSVHPYGNLLMTKKVLGSHILDYLEFATRNIQSVAIEDGKPVGESGAFCSVSGLKFKIDTSIESPVKVDNSGQFVSIDGPRRVNSVQVLEDGEYVDLDPNKEYIVASINFILENGGDGATMFMEDEIVPNGELFDYEVLIKYIVDICKGNLKDKYSDIEGRIVIN